MEPKITPKNKKWELAELLKLPKTRGQALSIGSPLYFNGSLCKYEHLCPRLTSSTKCQYCLLERGKIRREFLKELPIKKKKSLSPYKRHYISLTSVEGMLYTTAKRRAKASGLDFNIDIEDIHIPDHCPILGIKIYKQWGLTEQTHIARSNNPSLDRIDSSKGYIKGNVEVISYRANTLKKNGSSSEHQKIADYIKRYYSKS